MLDNRKSERPYPASQEYEQMLLNLFSFEQEVFPFVGSVGTRLHVNAENKRYSLDIVEVLHTFKKNLISFINASRDHYSKLHNAVQYHLMVQVCRTTLRAIK